MEDQLIDIEEQQRRERKAKRIAEMKREKERQQRFRKNLKKYIGAAAAVLVVVTGLVIGIVFAVGKDSEKTSRETLVAEAEMTDGSKALSGEASELDHAEASDSETADITENNEDMDSQEAFTEAMGAGEKVQQDVAKDENEMAEAVPTLFSAETTENTVTVVDENVISSYVVLIDVDTKEIIAQKDAKEIISPASMTKILTLLVAAEHVTDLEDTFTITREITDYSYSNDCSAVGFDDGEIVTVKDLLYGTILPSGADAAAGLAMYVSGSLEGFVDLMNEKLKELGISDTAHFTNCVGLYDEDHYCSVYDMAVILEAAIENDLCKEVLSAHTYTTTPTVQHPEGITISNWFLRRIEDKETPGEVLCAKTGFVNQSGNCAASYEETLDGGRYICVTANSHSSWRCIYDHVEIYNKYTE